MYIRPVVVGVMSGDTNRCVECGTELANYEKDGIMCDGCRPLRDALGGF